MFRKYWRSLMYNTGVVSILFIIFSLIWFESINIKHFYHMIGVLIPVHLFSFFVFELKLFSKHIWIRRMIATVFSLLVLSISGYIFGSIRFEFRSLLIYCIVAVVGVIIIVFVYYIVDKIEQQNLKLINQKLSERNTSRIE